MTSSDDLSKVYSVLRDVEDFLYERIERKMREYIGNNPTSSRMSITVDDFDEARLLRDRVNRAIGSLK